AARASNSERLAFIADSVVALAGLDDPTARARDVRVIDALLREVCRERRVAAALDAQTARINADPDALDALLRQQNYRPAFWRMAGQELGYRRFFDVNSLAGLRMEDERVFDAVHAMLLRGFNDTAIDGFRVDHPDGLRDPAQYFQRLHAARPGAW